MARPVTGIDNPAGSVLGNALFDKFMPLLTDGVRVETSILGAGLESGLPARVNGSTYPGLGTKTTPVQLVIAKTRGGFTIKDGKNKNRPSGDFPSTAYVDWNNSTKELKVKDLQICGSPKITGAATKLKQIVTLPLSGATILVDNTGDFEDSGVVVFGESAEGPNVPGYIDITYTSTDGTHFIGCSSDPSATGSYAIGDEVTEHVQMSADSGNILWGDSHAWTADNTLFQETFTFLSALTDMNSIGGVPATYISPAGPGRTEFKSLVWGTHANVWKIQLLKGAQLKTNLAGNKNDLIFAAYEEGANGELLSVEYLADVPYASTTASIVTLTGGEKKIQVKLKNTSPSSIQATAEDVRDAVEAATSLVAVAGADSDSKGIVTAMAKTNLSLNNCTLFNRVNEPNKPNHPERYFYTWLATGPSGTITTTAADMQDQYAPSLLMKAKIHTAGVLASTSGQQNLAGGAGGTLNVVDGTKLSAGGGMLCFTGRAMTYASVAGNVASGVQWAFWTNSQPYFQPEYNPDDATKCRIMLRGTGVRVWNIVPTQGVGSSFGSNVSGGLVLSRIKGELKNLYEHYGVGSPEAFSVNKCRNLKVTHSFFKFPYGFHGSHIEGVTENFCFQNCVIGFHPAAEIGETGTHMDLVYTNGWNNLEADKLNYRNYRNLMYCGRFTCGLFTGSQGHHKKNNIVYDETLFLGINCKGFSSNALVLAESNGCGCLKCVASLQEWNNDPFESPIYRAPGVPSNVVEPPITDPDNMNTWDNGLRWKTAESAFIQSKLPGPNEVNWPIAGNVDLIFGQDMSIGSLVAANLELRSGAIGGSLVARTIEVSGAGNRNVRINPDSNLGAGTTYFVVVKGDPASSGAGVRSQAGNGMPGDDAWSFTTALAGAPNVLSVDPPDGTLDVALLQPVVITFDVDMDITTLIYGADGVGTIRVEDDGGGLVLMTPLITGLRTFTMTPNEEYTGLMQYTVTVTTGVKALGGVNMVQQFTSTFTARETERQEDPGTKLILKRRVGGLLG